MSLFVLDTNLLSHYDRGDLIVVRRVDARPSAELAIQGFRISSFPYLAIYQVVARLRRISDPHLR